MLSNDFWHGFFIGDLFILFLAFLRQRLVANRTATDSSAVKGRQ